MVTDGAHGAFIGHGDEVIHVDAHNVSVVDTTGAGDCFAAGFLLGLVREQSLRVCGELATLQHVAADEVKPDRLAGCVEVMKFAHECPFVWSSGSDDR